MKSKATQTIAPSMRAASLCSVAVLAALSGLGLNRASADPGMTNLAIGGIATATNTDFGGTPNKGIDGNRDGNFNDGSVYYGNSPNSEGTDTNPSTTYFYQVNLGQNDYIDRVQFLPRTDVDQNVFGNFNISIYPNNGSGQPAATPSFSQNYNTTYFGDSFATLDPGAAAPGGAYGQFVRITRLDNNYWMTFAEMEVIGAPTPLKYTVSNDIALNKPVTTSSAPGFGAFISSGNDGDINGDFNAPDRPVYHSSNHSVGEYWQVDLGADTSLSYAELFARTVTNTTSQFDVEVFNSSMTLVDSVIVNNSDPQGTTPGYDHEVDLNGVTGEFVRVATTTDSYLSFSELEVFAAIAGSSLTWNNTGGTGDGLHWDTTNQNWNNGTGPALYTDGSDVSFTDTNGGNYNVSIASVVQPNSTTVNNSNAGYIFNGPGGIGGIGGLTKLGTASLTLATSNTYTGATNVSGGTVILAAAGALPAGTNLTIGSGASVFAKNLGSAVALTVGSLSVAGKLDLNNNALIVHSSLIAAVTTLVSSGFNNGAWNGATGIVSTAAASDTTHLTALGVIQNSVDGTTSGAVLHSTFEGQPASNSDVLVKYTYYGDTNLDGVVDGSDYSRIDSSFLSEKTGPSISGWFNGDFNYDGVVNGSDYTLIDNAFNSQGAQLTTQIAEPTAQIAALISAGAGSSAVPEPTTLGMTCVAGIGLLTRRRRRSGSMARTESCA